MMPDCIIVGKELDDSYGDTRIYPSIKCPCCKEFEEDFEDHEVCQYRIDYDNGVTILVCTYGELIGDREVSRTDIVNVCPYCGAKITIVGLENYHPKKYTDDSEWVV